MSATPSRRRSHRRSALIWQVIRLALGALRRAAGETTHPDYWAGFVAAGDWREPVSRGDDLELRFELRSEPFTDATGWR